MITNNNNTSNDNNTNNNTIHNNNTTYNTNTTQLYDPEILLYGIEEQYNGTPLSTHINKNHTNPKYLPNITLPPNIKSTTNPNDLSNTDILIIALPHQYIQTIQTFKKILKPNITVLSLIKGFIEHDTHFELISDYLNNLLNCKTNVLMGANIALDVSKSISGNIKYKSETTLGYILETDRILLYDILNCNMFKVTCIQDVHGVELCGSLKNVISLGYGIVDGLNCSGNTKVAFLRNGLIEIKKFMKTFYPETSEATLFESCGIADLIVSCCSGRNYKFGVSKVTNNLSVDEFEKQIGNQKIQGVGTVKCLVKFLCSRNVVDEFPVFLSVYNIFACNVSVESILECF
ncbi:glycerol-3-phosphate dehydrogenase [Vairimorpha apis BRL 01]|uniref:Glycerol-3-phosphate dehydrogenase [NAD(+)] n=1 Tax=Vairimorpha apis BRL 01 TaxID=1037528 RepID=T0MGR6_9MICR|nr:glycerol-3-phosphate dehydrogenase [Vairimorpha apis BRL 01]